MPPSGPGVGWWNPKNPGSGLFAAFIALMGAPRLGDPADPEGGGLQGSLGFNPMMLLAGLAWANTSYMAQSGSILLGIVSINQM